MTIAITGATGQLGRLVVQGMQRASAAQDVVALVRSPEKAADLGVPVRGFDYTDAATLAPALEGVKTLLLISSSEVGQRAVQHRNVIEAAKQAGAGHIVYTSLLHADRSPLSLAVEHRETEAMLRESGIPFTILRNGWYTENDTAAIGAALAGGAVIGSAGDGRISSATRADYAAAAVAVLTGRGHEGKVYELAGDTAWTKSDLAAEISRQTGKTISYRNLSPADYADALAGFGIPADFARMIAGWDAAVSEGAVFDDSRQLSTLIGRPTTPLADAVAEALRSQAGTPAAGH